MSALVYIASVAVFSVAALGAWPAFLADVDPIAAGLALFATAHVIR